MHSFERLGWLDCERQTLEQVLQTIERRQKRLAARKALLRRKLDHVRIEHALLYGTITYQKENSASGN